MAQAAIREFEEDQAVPRREMGVAELFNYNIAARQLYVEICKAKGLPA